MKLMFKKRGAEKKQSTSEEKKLIRTYEGEVRGIKTLIRRYESDPYPPPTTLEARSQTEYLNTDTGR